MEKHPGTLFIIAAPSGGGKTSLVKALLTEVENIVVSISHTTRPIRAQEQNGVDYFFVEHQQFQDMIQKQQFVEYAKVFDYDYGTSVAQIETRIQQGEDVLLDIDWQGALQIRKRFKNVVSVFVVPPSIEVLRERLQARQRDPLEIIESRMIQAQSEMSHYAEFDYLLVNDDFNVALNELKSIVIAHRLRMAQQKNVRAQLLSNLLNTQ